MNGLNEYFYYGKLYNSVQSLKRHTMSISGVVSALHNHDHAYVTFGELVKKVEKGNYPGTVFVIEKFELI